MIPREIYNNESCIKGFHTQEHWYSDPALTEPIKCNALDAWLGVGYYFWIDRRFAYYWGVDCKMKTGSFDVYRCFIEEKNLLNTVFNESDYYFFQETIEKVIERLNLKGNDNRDNLRKVNRYLADNLWSSMNIQGIIYNDTPQNNSQGRVYSEVNPLYYLKRIQVVVFDIKIIHNFEPEEEDVRYTGE